MNHDFILLDRTGSMDSQGKWQEAVNACNAYVKKLAEQNIDTGVTLIVFDKEGDHVDFRVVRDRIIPKTFLPFGSAEGDAEIKPRGWTPLNDAIGRTVALANSGSYEKCAIVIITDGLENASREISTERAKELLDECRKKNWQVIFLGADYDNMMQAASYGAKREHAMPMKAGLFGATMDSLGAARAAYQWSGAAMDFSEEDRAKLSKEDTTSTP